MDDGLIERLLGDDALALAAKQMRAVLTDGDYDDVVALSSALEALGVENAIQSLQSDKDQLLEQMAEIQMNARKWMEAHDKLKAGKPYDLPSPADFPDALQSLQSEIASLRGDLERVMERENRFLNALIEAHAAIESLDEDALGMANLPDGWTGQAMQYPIRDELLAKIDAALTVNTGD